MKREEDPPRSLADALRAEAERAEWHGVNAPGISNEERDRREAMAWAPYHDPPMVWAGDRWMSEDELEARPTTDSDPNDGR